MRNPFKRAGKKKTAATLQNDNRQKTENTTTGMPENSDATTATQGKLLVMGQESAFSSEVMDYAIDMAQRMSFEILALNSAPLSCDSFSRFSTSRSKLCQEFQALSEESVIAFRDAAEASEFDARRRVSKVSSCWVTKGTRCSAMGFRRL